MTRDVQRHFATVGQRQVHYRRAGQGPPVVLLHEAPRSSASFLPLIRRLAARYTVIAPDTPGNGLSEPLGIEQPTMSEFANALGEFLDVLGIQRCAIYGVHTGAACALEFARRYPRRVARAIINGYLQIDPALRADILANYFAPLSIDWSGSHLAWLWARMQEQWSFFPWYRKTLANRPECDPPSPEVLHADVLEMLDAGDAYRESYRAAFEYDAASTVQRLKVPTLITTPRDDLLFPALSLMPPPAACVRVRPADDTPHVERLLEAELAAIEESLPEPPAATTSSRDGAPWSSYVRAGTLQLHVLRSDHAAACGRPCIVQHSTVESARCVEPLLTALAAGGPAFALDLPGRGLSDDPPAEVAPSIDYDSDHLSEALQQLGVRDALFVGFRGGATVGVECARRRDPAFASLVALQPPWTDRSVSDAELARLAPRLLPDEAGTQFLRAWHQLRGAELYEPWYERRQQNIRRYHAPELDPRVIQRRVEALFRCGPLAASYWAAVLRYPAFERLATLATPLLIGDPSPAVAARARTPGTLPKTARVAALPQCDLEALAQSLRDFMGENHA